MRWLLPLFATIFLAAVPVRADVPIGTVSVAGEPLALAVNEQTNQVYVSCHAANTVTVIDGVTHGTSLIPVGAEPYAIAVNPNTNKIYVANYGASTVTAIDGATHATQTVPVGVQPIAIAVNTQTNKIYVVNDGSGANSISVIDGATNAVTTIAVAGRPYSLAINEVTNKIYIGHATGALNEKVSIIDGTTNAPVSTVTVPGSNLYAIAVNPVTNKVYVGGGGYLGVISEPAHTTQTISTANSPIQIAIDTTRNLIYTANAFSQTSVTLVNGSTNGVQQLASTQSPWSSIAQNPLTGKFYVGRAGIERTGVADSTINVFWGAAPVNNIPGGAGEQHIAINKSTNRVFVTNSLDSSVTVIDANDAVISGRVLTPAGQAIRSATVILSGSGGSRRIATTGSFGTFSFPPLITGYTYTLTVSSKRYRFAPQTRTLNGNITGLDLIGLE